MENTPKLVKIFSFLGLVPVLFGVLGSFEFSFIPDLINNALINVSLIYAALILSFLGGVLFGFKVTKVKNPKFWPLFFSFLPTFWALFALQLPVFKASALAIGFLIAYELDRKFFKERLPPNWWLSLRLPLTAIMVLLLIVMGFNV